MKNGIDGGNAFAEGGYGCVFRPALKCKNETGRRNGVSKLMLTDKAYAEYNEVTRFVDVIDKIPNFRSLFTLPYNICTPAPLDKSIDLRGFDKKCSHFIEKGKLSAKTVNHNLNKMRAITLPDGGMDVDMQVKKITGARDFIRLNNSLMRLLKYGIVPMNDRKLYHFDVKDTNVLVDKGFVTRLTDWGLAGMVESKETIPSVISNRPLQSNLPFSNILFNPDTLGRIDAFYNENDNKKNYTYDLLEAFMREEVQRISEDIGSGHYSYLKGIYDDHVFAETDYVLKDEIVGYLTQVVFNWRHPVHGFDAKNYFFKVFLPNADIWGFVTIYMSFLVQSSNQSTEVGVIFTHKLRQLIITNLLYDGHLQIDLRVLMNDLKDLNTVLRSGPPNDLGTEFGVGDKVGVPRTPDTRFLRSTKAITFKAVQTNRKKHLVKLIARAAKNKTKTIRSSEGAKSNERRKGVGVKGLRKRCPNRMHRSKKNGRCVPVSTRATRKGRAR